ncbi:hypothetical protein [Paraburkholderia sp. J8-2]|uniref:hypothetical protein n=1 Tax=Paraburkholderia sp. J8-2 TaxID=2805440 RepID=UPI002AB623D8|nr:hypothetical protein [Paraburkholderia sp. J8-2]
MPLLLVLAPPLVLLGSIFLLSVIRRAKGSMITALLGLLFGYACTIAGIWLYWLPPLMLRHWNNAAIWLVLVAPSLLVLCSVVVVKKTGVAFTFAAAFAFAYLHMYTILVFACSVLGDTCW